MYSSGDASRRSVSSSPCFSVMRTRCLCADEECCLSEGWWGDSSWNSSGGEGNGEGAKLSRQGKEGESEWQWAGFLAHTAQAKV